MSSIDSLFTQDAAAPQVEPDVTAERVEGLFGGPRAPQAAASAPIDDTPALQAIVGGRGRAMMMGAGPVKPTRIRRTGNGVDLLNVITAVAAVVAVVAVSAVAWIAISSSTPEKDALRTLSQTEAVLANETQAVNAEIGRVAQTQAEGIAFAQQLELPLAQVTGMTDDAVLAAAQQARSDYLTAVEAVGVPATLDPYATPDVDESSLPSIGSAIDEVSVRSDDVSQVSKDVDALRTQLFSLNRTLLAALATFAATVPASAADIVDENPDAKKSLREAVTQTGDAVAASGLKTPESIATLTAYATAVTALRADQARAEDAIAEAERLAREQRNSGGSRGSTSPTQPTTPTDPTTPVDPVPAPEPTTPIDPPGNGGGNG